MKFCDPNARIRISGLLRCGILASMLVAAVGLLQGGELSGGDRFRRQVEPILKEFCHDCHADGMNKGGVTLDEFASDQALLENRELWFKALKNLRAGIMPPSKKPQPSEDQKGIIDDWIKTSVFRADPANPDPGRVTVRRLNRVEYRNTIRDLLAVDFNTREEFPPDDSGHGFDNIGDVLTLPPMLLEKYLAAAKTIVTKAVPSVPYVPAERVIAGRDFGRQGPEGVTTNNMFRGSDSSLSLSYYERASVSNTFRAAHSGTYQLQLNLTANERFVDNQFDYNKCLLIFKVDGQELLRQEFTREGGRGLRFEFDQQWNEGDHELTFELEPLTPEVKQVRSLSLRINSVTVRGPLEKEQWVRPENYERFFGQGPPSDDAGRRQYAREVMERFVRRAYRRSVDEPMLDRLVALAEARYSQPGKTFEEGIGHAMTAVLASPRFLFREEAAEVGPAGKGYPLVDEYSLASRLSYFLWASMPDDELFDLAGQNKLRTNLDAQVTRMMADTRFTDFIRNFVGQWLQARDVESIAIEARQVLARELAPDPELDRRRQRIRELRSREQTLTPEETKELDELRAKFGRRFGMPLRAELTGDLRRAMRQETEQTFGYVIRENRSLLELLDSDYAFLNERLAKHYGLTNLNVVGDDIRRVALPPDSSRGGLLTQGTVLVVTSNPTRTSPVKRGLFILENILGTPPPPPPPDITPLEDAAKGITNRTVSLRETLALHREQPLCSSCHNRMDPLGLAFENFNAMGMFRETERAQPIDATGTLLSGETFASVRELKQILTGRHSREFYQTLTEKMLTYALGRGLEYYDVDTVDRIVNRLTKVDGRPSELFAGIVESAPFQKTRPEALSKISPPTQSAQQRAEAKVKP